MKGEPVSAVRGTDLALKLNGFRQHLLIHDSLFQLFVNFCFFFIVVSCGGGPRETGGPTFYYNYITSISGSGFTAVGPGAQAHNFQQSPARGTLYFSV